MMCLQSMPLQAEVSLLDCAAFEYVLSLEGQASALDLDARDALARRIERHGETLGLSRTQVRLNALALRDNDRELSDLILTDRNPVQQAYGDCLASVEMTDADTGLTMKPPVKSPSRQNSIRVPDIAVWSIQTPVPWGMLAAFFGGICLIWGIVWLAGMTDRRSRRRLRRFNCDIAAVLRLDDRPDLPVRVTDISMEGCRLSLEKAGVTVGAQSLLAMGRNTISARIVWCNKHFCGVQFATKLPESDLIEFLRQDQKPEFATAPG